MATMASVEAGADEGLSPRQQPDAQAEQALEPFGSMKNSIEPLDNPVDPDVQTTVTDFLDFTEYLPADVTRSLTLIGKLDESYTQASTKVHELTKAWGDLPNLAPENRKAPVELRAEISEQLNLAISSRKNSYAEALRNQDNVNTHAKRIMKILASLNLLNDNFPPPEEQKSPVVTKSPQLVRVPKISLRGEGAQRKHRPRVPRITVPGEVLAPYEIDYNAYTDSSDEDSDDDAESLPGRASAGPTRIKLVKNQKVPKGRPLKAQKIQIVSGGAGTTRVRSSVSPKPPRSQRHLRPPPENAQKGSSDAPWLQLTGYELAVLRKRMKKNSSWSPSDTMIARELKQKGRGFDSWQIAKKEAEDAGRPFQDDPPDPIPEVDGDAQASGGALSLEAASAAADKQKGQKKGTQQIEAKTAKEEESLAQLAAKEAEESTRRMQEAVRAIFQEYGTPDPGPSRSNKATVKTPAPKKRKRDATTEAEAEKPEAGPSAIKRTKTETPVPIPQRASSTQATQESQTQSSQLTPGGPNVKPHSTTPVPLPNQDQSGSSKAQSPLTNGGSTVTTTVPVKLPAETPIPPPVHSKTPIPPPVRETRTREAARKEQQKEKEKEKEAQVQAAPAAKSSSRAATPAARPPSRGTKAPSQEPQQSLAADRPRRASTARNTPAPELQQSSRLSGAGAGGGVGKRQKRPAPGVVSRTNSGGNSAVGRRKAAPKKGRGRKDKDKGGEPAEVEVEVDDEGNTIDPDEARYCLCNRVSFGTMIQCENVDNCKMEWFHLECVGLTTVVARTTKWYCPECRVLLNIGEKGEVSARGVKK